MHIVTDHVFPDEPSWGLAEGPLKMPQPDGSTPMHWVQRVFVVRGDAIAKYMIDFGPTEDFDRAQPLLMPSMGENTVAQLQEHAEKNRHDHYWANRVDEMLAESTLAEDYFRQREQNRGVIHNRSSFGAGGHFQRNGYPRAVAREAYRGK